MSLPKLIEKWILFFERLIGPPPEPESDEQTFDHRPPSSGGTETPRGKYAELHHSVEQTIENLVRQVVPEHRKYAKNDVLELHYVEVEPTNEASRELLDAFFHEFVPAARQEWIRDLLGVNAAISTDYLAGLFRKEDRPVIEHLDPYQQILNYGTPCSFKVTLWSRWVRSVEPARASFSKDAARQGAGLTLRIADAQGQRPQRKIDRYPVKIGRQGDIALLGTYVSGEHCTLHWKNGSFSLEDHSTNGTWIDGVKLHHQTKPLSGARCCLKLGSEKGDIKDAPELELVFPIPAGTGGVTPVSGGDHTPIAGVHPTLRGILHVTDATGHPKIDITELPFRIGRSGDCHYATPATHVGVSGHHLTIESIDEFGAVVTNLAHNKNGTARGDTLLPEQFRWQFGEDITLAPKWKQNPPVLIQLRRPK